MSAKFFEHLSKSAERDHKCGACKRPFKGQEMADFQTFVRDLQTMAQPPLTGPLHSVANNLAGRQRGSESSKRSATNGQRR